jgi:hypothetical protein
MNAGSLLPLVAYLSACGTPIAVEPVLVVVNISPSGGAANIALDAEVTAAFSDGLDEATVAAENVWLESDGDPVDAVLSYDAITFTTTLTPVAPLLEGTQYDLVLSGIAALDGTVLTSTVTSSFTTLAATAANNALPFAAAGGDQQAMPGDPVLLDGTASYDPDGDALTYVWVVEAWPPASVAAFDDPTSATPTFVPDLPGMYILSLVVSDDFGSSSADYLTLDVQWGDD